MDFYYSTTTTPFAKGKRFKNPIGFWKVDEAATHVYVVGQWPRVVAAYEAANVPVTVIDPGDKDVLFNGGVINRQTIVEMPFVPPKQDAAKRDQRASVSIPEDWQQMPWADLRRLAASVTDQPVVNKAQATAVIETELALRKETV
jgi:hypothetical protein